MASVSRQNKELDFLKKKIQTIIEPSVGKGKKTSSLFRASDTKILEKMTPAQIKSVISWLEQNRKEGAYIDYARPASFKAESPDYEKSKDEKRLVEALTPRLKEYFIVEKAEEEKKPAKSKKGGDTRSRKAKEERETKKEKEERELEEAKEELKFEKMTGEPTIEPTIAPEMKERAAKELKKETKQPTAPPSKEKRKAKKLQKKMEKEIDISLEPVESILKEEISKHVPKQFNNAEEVKPMKEPYQFSYILEPVGLQEKPYVKAPVNLQLASSFKSEPMKDDVSSFDEANRLNPPLQEQLPKQDTKPKKDLEPYGSVAGHDFNQYMGYNRIVPKEKLEASEEYANSLLSKSKNGTGSIQVNMVSNKDPALNKPSEAQDYSAQNQPVKNSEGDIVRPMKDEIYTPEEIQRIRSMPVNEFIEYMEGVRKGLFEPTNKKPLRFIPEPPKLRFKKKEEPIEPINRERLPQTQAYTEDELKIMRAEQANKTMQELTEAQGMRERERNIGNRESTGLATRFSIPGKDLLVKPQAEIEKSISAFANMSWIEKGTRADSKLADKSSLQQMLDHHNEMRYSDVYTPVSIQPIPREKLFEMYRDEIARVTNNDHYIPEYDGNYTQERMPQNAQDIKRFGNRPIGSREPTLDDLEDYICMRQPCQIVGTENLGMSSQNFNNDSVMRPYFKQDSVQYPQTIFEHRSHRRRFI